MARNYQPTAICNSNKYRLLRHLEWRKYNNFSVLIVLLLHCLFPHTPCRWLHQNEMQFAYVQVGAALSIANYLCQNNDAYKKRLPLRYATVVTNRRVFKLSLIYFARNLTYLYTQLELIYTKGHRGTLTILALPNMPYTRRLGVLHVYKARCNICNI